MKKLLLLILAISTLISEGYSQERGGIIVYERNEHGLVAAPTDLGRMDWHSAKKACDDLKLNGFSDWRLPNYGESEQLASLDRIDGFAEKYYWSNKYAYPGEAYKKHLGHLAWATGSMDEPANVRCVRTF